MERPASRPYPALMEVTHPSLSRRLLQWRGLGAVSAPSPCNLLIAVIISLSWLSLCGTEHGMEAGRHPKADVVRDAGESKTDSTLPVYTSM
jgi:hypothetical protein